ncbi:F-box/LRR-repeat protein 3 [Selaginella moellendorffii]|uniref:F-box/LRR-repeat protein 3 n=1 Tax=Selaginella moellendorffii TaxID=88036 RepID=UPI000D1CEBB1|nr:F-box/LRR-repeat protein 3 [Selaginella moellendorffii]|eukprot:XP_024525365.1 F-box/LRR-repeat protein 3 [Selaginella moellendorffii]
MYESLGCGMHPIRRSATFDAGLGCLVAGCKKLQVVVLNGCVGILDAGLCFLASNSKEPTTIDASYTEVSIERSLMTASSNLPSLRVLNLAACSNVGDAGFSYKYIIAGISLPAVGSSWKAHADPNMAGCEIAGDGLRLNNISLLIDRCSCLEELDVTDCNIDDAGLECIAKCRFLKTLKLGFCKVSDNGTEHVGRNCSNLIKLDLYRSGNVGDAGVASIAAGCRKLRILILSYCPNITDASIVFNSQLSYLQQLCKRVGLEKKLPEFKNLLNLSYCRISNAGLVMLGNLRCLQNVKLVQIGNVSVEVLAASLLSCVYFKKACHGLENSGQYGSSPKSFVESFHVRSKTRERFVRKWPWSLNPHDQSLHPSFP